MLTLEQQAAFVEEAPEIFLPIPGGWGRMGHTHIRLAAASGQQCSIQPATQICTECAWNGEGWLCEASADWMTEHRITEGKSNR